MATDVIIAGQTYKKRSAVAVWLLPFVTLGIYHFVWWHKINNEARRFLGDRSIKPGVAVLALIPGFILILPPYVSVYRTAGRVRRMQRQAGLTELATPWIALILAFIFSLHSLYLQLELNKLWDRYLTPAGTGNYAAPPPPSPLASAPPALPPSR